MSTGQPTSPSSCHASAPTRKLSVKPVREFSNGWCLCYSSHFEGKKMYYFNVHTGESRWVSDGPPKDLYSELEEFQPVVLRNGESRSLSGSDECLAPDANIGLAMASHSSGTEARTGPIQAVNKQGRPVNIATRRITKPGSAFMKQLSQSQQTLNSVRKVSRLELVRKETNSSAAVEKYPQQNVPRLVSSSRPKPPSSLLKDTTIEAAACATAASNSNILSPTTKKSRTMKMNLVFQPNTTSSSTSSSPLSPIPKLLENGIGSSSVSSCSSLAQTPTPESINNSVDMMEVDSINTYISSLRHTDLKFDEQVAAGVDHKLTELSAGHDLEPMDTHTECSSFYALHVVLDTCVLIENLDVVKEVANRNFPGIGNPVLVLPNVVLSELDKLKDNKYSCERMFTLSQKARSAIRFIQGNLKSSNPWFKSERKMNIPLMVNDVPCEVNDDEIVKVAFYTQNNLAKDTYVFTNDRNLDNKCSTYNLRAFDHHQIIDAILDVSSEPGAAMPTTTTTTTTTTTAVIDRQLGTAYRCVCDLGSVMSVCLAQVAEDVLRREARALGDGTVPWTSLCKVPPPHDTIAKVLTLLERHWLGVFKDFERTNTGSARKAHGSIVDMLAFYKQHCAYGVTIGRVKELVQSSVAILDYFLVAKLKVDPNLLQNLLNTKTTIQEQLLVQLDSVPEENMSMSSSLSLPSPHRISPLHQTHQHISPLHQTHQHISPHRQTHQNISPNHQTHQNICPKSQVWNLFLALHRIFPECIQYLHSNPTDFETMQKAHRDLKVFITLLKKCVRDRSMVAAGKMVSEIRDDTFCNQQNSSVTLGSLIQDLETDEVARIIIDMVQQDDFIHQVQPFFLSLQEWAEELGQMAGNF